MPEHDHIIPVAIIGSGLGGSAAAAFLAHAGIPSVIIERHDHPSERPRAWIISPRTLELLRELGIDDQVTQRGAAGPWDMVMADTLNQAPTGPAAVDESAALSPTGAATCDQDILEDILRTYAVDHGATTLWGRHATGVFDHGDTTEITLEDGGTVKARYVIVAEGAHAALTSSLGITITVPDGGQADPSQRFDQVLFRSPELDGIMESRPGNVFMSPATETIVFRRSSGRWQIQRQGGLVGDPTDDIATAVGESVSTEILDHSDWTPSAHSAETYRSGNTFLIGDAAHSFPPSLGMGGNLAIADAHNLAWKLAWVMAGRAGAGLLDSYEQERKPVGTFIVLRSVAQMLGAGNQTDGGEPLDLLTAQLGLGYPAGASDALIGEGADLTVADPRQRQPLVGMRLPHHWLPDGRSTIDLTTLDTFAAVGPGQHENMPVPYTQIPNLPTSGQPDDVWLIRPDGHVAAELHPTAIAGAIAEILQLGAR